MPKKKIPKADTKLKTFIKAGGRKGAEADFNSILKQAVKPNNTNKLKDKNK